VSASLSVVGYGMVTSLGNNGPASAAAVWGGIRGVAADNLWDKTAGEQLSLARPRMPQWWEGREMLAELCAPAVSECLVSAAALAAPPLSDPQTIPIALIVAPPERPFRWPSLDQLALEDLAHKLDRLLPPHSTVIPRGRTGIGYALHWAQDVLLRRGAHFCIVAGVESFLRQVLADHYIDERRLLCGNNSNGFIPGEAGAAVLLARSGTYAPELVLAGSGSANDPSGAGGNAAHPVTGDGLTAAMKGALAGAAKAFADVDLRISDANGEHFKFREIILADARVSRLRPPGAAPRRYGYLEHWHPIEYVGEVGAAIFPLMLGYAYDAGVNRHLDGPVAMVHAAEDNGERVAVVTRFRS
jgi:3-oxoacyl-[acyl-carrier-protein] synthase-1